MIQDEEKIQELNLRCHEAKAAYDKELAAKRNAENRIKDLNAESEIVSLSIDCGGPPNAKKGISKLKDEHNKEKQALTERTKPITTS